MTEHDNAITLEQLCDKENGGKNSESHVIYHVRITINDELSDLVALDLSHDDLVERVITPYEKGNPIVLRGRTVALQNLKELRISQTDEHSSQIIPRIKAEQANWTVRAPISLEWYAAKSGIDVTDKFIKTAPGSQATTLQISHDVNAGDNPRVVMVVHGRDERLRNSMFEFLRAIDLRPLEWSEAVAATNKATPYVGEVLDAAFGMAQAVVVLLTGDDIVSLRKDLQKPGDKDDEVNPTPQARPNVLFEAGMAMATFEKRTLIVEIGTLRPFSDIGGRHVVRLDNSEERRQEIIQRLTTAGCAVNRKSTDWIKAGDFSVSAAKPVGPTEEAIPERGGSEVSELEEKALLLLSKASNRGFTTEYVSSHLNVLPEKAKFALVSLKQRGMVTYSAFHGKSARWQLVQAGRKILVDRGLL